MLNPEATEFLTLKTAVTRPLARSCPSPVLRTDFESLMLRQAQHERGVEVVTHWVRVSVRPFGQAQDRPERRGFRGSRRGPGWPTAVFRLKNVPGGLFNTLLTPGRGEVCGVDRLW
jgi:hypothetical protein